MYPKFKLGEKVKTKTTIVSYFIIQEIIKLNGIWHYRTTMAIPGSRGDFKENEISKLTKEEQKYF